MLVNRLASIEAVGVQPSSRLEKTLSREEQQELCTKPQNKASVRDAIMPTSAGWQSQMVAADRAVPRFGAAALTSGFLDGPTGR